MAPDFERLARTPWPIACCASSGTRPLQFSLGALVLQKGRWLERNAPANSAQELEALISTIRTASIRGRRRLDAERPRGLAVLDTAPEFSPP